MKQQRSANLAREYPGAPYYSETVEVLCPICEGWKKDFGNESLVDDDGDEHWICTDCEEGEPEEDPNERRADAAFARAELDELEHTTDAHCNVDPETDACRTCGVIHGDPCPDCGGRGFHNRPDCYEGDRP